MKAQISHSAPSPNRVARPPAGAAEPVAASRRRGDRRRAPGIGGRHRTRGKSDVHRSVRKELIALHPVCRVNNHFGPGDIRFLPSSARAAAHVNSRPITNFKPFRRQYRTVALPIRP
jgi:hypothetical protein